MINLLGTDVRHELRSARLNTALIRYVSVGTITLVVLVLLSLFSSWWLNNRIMTAKAEQASNEKYDAASSATIAKGTSFKADLTKIQSVITNRTHFGSALLNIADALPAGVTVQTADLTPTFLTTPLKLSAVTRDTQSALTIKQQLSESKMFKSVSLDNADCEVAGACNVSLTVTLNPIVFTQEPGSTL